MQNIGLKTVMVMKTSQYFSKKVGSPGLMFALVSDHRVSYVNARANLRYLNPWSLSLRVDFTFSYSNRILKSYRRSPINIQGDVEQIATEAFIFLYCSIGPP